MNSAEITIIESAVGLTFQSLFLLPPSYQSHSDWFGNSLPGGFRWHLAQDSQRWYFGVQSSAGAPSFDSSIGLGEFREGLWLKDVGELFVLESDSGAYREWNLGPQGGWWTAAFESYRVRGQHGVEDRGPGEVRTFSAVGEHQWQAALAGPLDHSPFKEPNPVLHLAGILGSPRQRFLTSAPSPQGEPDFHQVSTFRAAKKVRAP